MFANFLAIGTLAVRENGTYIPFSAEAWSYVGQMTLLGVGMVFAVLAVLWAILGIFKLVFAPKPKAPIIPKTESKPKPAVQPVAAPAAVPAVQSDDAELVAIITAAVAAYMAEEGTEYTGGFRVVSFKRVRGGRTWNTK
jgi:sodium pump decarboxylase gamma subunit